MADAQNALYNSEITRYYQKRELTDQLKTQIINLNSLNKKLKLDQMSMSLQQQNIKAAKIKLGYGKLDAFTYSQQLQSSIHAKNQIINDKISYLSSYLDYLKMMNQLLPTWHIHINTQHIKRTL